MRTSVVIPVKDRLDLTAQIVDDLRSIGGWDELIICDNGSGSQTRRWLRSQRDITTRRMPNAGIHEMWNYGAELALKHGPTDIAFLNNDLRLGDDMLARMQSALRDDALGLLAVSPNYDGRALDGVQYVDDICAGRYDGTGGMAGFAFMARGELFDHGYRFPKPCVWFCGDNDIVVEILEVGGRIGIVGDATCEHVGGATGGWSEEVPEQQRRDYEAWLRWRGVA